ncbi:MAG TPA: DUF814 domain-containing protein [Candidatus Diapherotrites archaeon]|uniref:DUF814 domain-containing protein n=1 Tax=Candidatus Iainarchaeum sp. TaxID=3101447 RepID=A0A7J4JEZ0_9ARCH|nr:DUF814 domain-containing protein [Candidatus Diapherotrites archaeon]HIH16341.1 DUF814 domain-containing protein [Candidatus Diapherotrites archaeon]
MALRIQLNLDKSLQENASAYYALGKKAKKKLEGVKKALEATKQRMQRAMAEKEAGERRPKMARKRKKQWFEKFHWFLSSDGLLVIAGRDARQNEAVVKKHMEDHDLYFHAEIVGAPHTVVKTEKKQAGEATKREAAQFAAVFSKAWALKQGHVDVYAVKPEQVSKKAPTGEAMGTGAFMIYGKREWFRKTRLEFAVGVKREGECLAVLSGPETAVKAQSLAWAKLVLGEDRKSEAAKKLKKQFEEKLAKQGVEGEVSLDELVAMLPSDNIRIEWP